MAHLVRVFTSSTVPPIITDQSFAPATTVRVNIDVEERPAVVAPGGGPFALVVTAINRNTGAIVIPTPAVPTTPASGVATFYAGGGAEWPAGTPNRRFEYDIPAAFGAAGDFCEVLVALRVGAVAPYETHIASCDWVRTTP